MSDKKQDLPPAAENYPSEANVGTSPPPVPNPQPSGSSGPPETQPSAPPPTLATPTPTSSAQLPQDRSDLVAKARAFLSSPQIVQQDSAAKRNFLHEKGLNPDEIEGLMREHPTQPPVVPPRSYPQPPLSNLPHLLLGVIRLFSWLAGGSAVLVLIYYRYLLPRITQSAQARNALKSHHLVLLQRLTTSLSALKETQAETFSVLPKPEPFKEPAAFASCQSVGQVLKTAGDDADITTIHPVSLLRCAIADLGQGKTEIEADPTTEDVFRYLEGRIPWLVESEGIRYEERLWETLNTCPFFNKLEAPPASADGQVEALPTPDRWTYTAPEPVPPIPLVNSLDELASELPKQSQMKKSPYQHTLQALSDFTGYISTQLYLPYRPPGVGAGVPSGTTPTSVEEEFKRDIRALKGLVLNRRTFMPTIPRPFANR